MNAHAALILAAGASARLGLCKQSLTRDGEALLRRCVRMALQTRPRRCLVVLGAAAGELRPLLDGLEVEVVINQRWLEGMGSSLAALRDHLRGDASLSHSLILSCDQPALEASHLQQLVAAARDSAAAGAVTGYDGARGIPAMVPQAMFEQAVLEGDQGLRQVFARADGCGFACIAAPALGLDVDTPADLEAAIARGWLDPLDSRALD